MFQLQSFSVTHSSDDFLKGTDSLPVCDACDIVKDLSSSISMCPTHEKEEGAQGSRQKRREKGRRVPHVHMSLCRNIASLYKNL
ncbi:hypothetical protein CEXT_294751 [Caerostris extrusa]|uniref:Uncharacterized protein n=1 Tax=Caerostris extrusa TaxID=172846 RepID=A0AAV4PBD1_CAEEX|nr:hypothetical protein CEXT_294751 [Caerostris extrusa]